MSESLSLTEQFRKDMWKNFPNTCLWRLTDDKEVRATKKGSGAYAIEEDEIEKYNSDKVKNGIFFTPNGDYILNKTNRKKEVANNVYAFIVDRDINKDKFWETFPLEPSFVTETMQGYHAYWLLSEPFEYSKPFGSEKNSPKTFDVIEGFLCDFFGGDPKAKDISRILRLPGSRYWKDNKGELIIKTILYKPENKYTLEEFLTLHASTGRIVRDSERTRKELGQSGYSLVEDINRLVNVVDVLYDLGGSKRDVRPSGAIYEEGAVTGGFKYNKRENYLNSFSPNDRPEGGPYAVAKWFIKNPSDTFKYFREKYGIGELIDKKNQISVETVVNEITGEKMEAVKIKTSKGDIWINPLENKTVYINGNEELLLLDGILIVKGFYKDSSNTNVYVVEYKTPYTNGTIEMKELGKGSMFEGICSQVGITFFGTKKQLKEIISYIHSTNERYIFINKLGILDNGTVINKTGRYIFEEDGKKYFVNIQGFYGEEEGGIVMKLSTGATLEDVKETIEKLRKSYKSGIIVPMFVCFAMSLFVAYIRKVKKFFPSTVLVGLTQSGKTHNRRLLMKILGLLPALETQASTTEFVVMAKCIHFFPMLVTEFKNTDTSFNWDSFLKNNFDGSANNRGTTQQVVQSYPANASVIIDGESRSMTNSVYSRSINFTMNPQYKGELQTGYKNVNSYFIENYDNIYGLEMSFDEILEELKEYTKDNNKQEKDRIIENYALILAFADCFGLYDMVKDDVLELLNTQFMMISDDGVDRTLKQIVALAINNKFLCEFDDAENVIKIDFSVDELKYDSRKISDLESAIKLANHHFSGGDKPNLSDRLDIPLDYLFDNINMHNMVNRLLNFLVNNTEISHKTALKIIDYAEKFSYTKQFFYNILINLPEFIQRKRDRKPLETKDIIDDESR